MNVEHADRDTEAEPPFFLVGQDCEGHWLAVEQHGLGGGFFVSKDAALTYVRLEAGRGSGACRLVAEPISHAFTTASSTGTRRLAA